MTNADPPEDEQARLPSAFSDFIKFAAKETKIDEEKLRSAVDRFPPSRGDLINVLWLQASQNMALLEAMIAMVGDDKDAKVAALENLLKTMREGFAKMAATSGELVKAGMRDSNKSREQAGE